MHTRPSSVLIQFLWMMQKNEIIFFSDFYFLSYHENASEVEAILSTKMTITQKKSDNRFFIRFSTVRIYHKNGSKTEKQGRESAYP